MFNCYHYYLLDTISETILGSFYAKSDSLARRFIKAFDFDKARVDIEDCLLIKNTDPIHELETYSEVKSYKLSADVSDLLYQDTLEFENAEK